MLDTIKLIQMNILCILFHYYGKLAKMRKQTRVGRGNCAQSVN